MSMSRVAIARIGAFAAVLFGMLAFTSTSAFAAGSPIVTTSAASGVSIYGATLNGTVNPNGATTTYKFEYGATVSYGSSTAVQTAPGESSSVSKAIGALSPETTYHYRVSATNSFGTSYGADQTLKTLGWSLGGKRLSEVGESATYKTQGTFSLKSTVGGEPVSLSCAEAGEGILGGSLTLSMSGCTVSQPSGCTLKPFTFQLNSAMSTATNYGKLEFQNCIALGTVQVANLKETSDGGFLAGTGFENVQQPVTLTGNDLRFGPNPAEITDTSTWHSIYGQEGKRLGLGWHIEGTPLPQLESENPTHPAMAASSGTVSFEFTSYAVTVTCSSSGYFSLTGEKEFSLGSCSIKGASNCHVEEPVTPIKLTSTYGVPTEKLLATLKIVGEGCTMPGGGNNHQYLIYPSSGFTVTAGAEKSRLPVTLAGVGIYAQQNVNVTFNTEWELSGSPYTSKKFGTIAN